MLIFFFFKHLFFCVAIRFSAKERLVLSNLLHILELMWLWKRSKWFPKWRSLLTESFCWWDLFIILRFDETIMENYQGSETCKKKKKKITQFIGACEEDNKLYIAMEYAPNGNLRQLLKGKKPFFFLHKIQTLTSLKHCRSINSNLLASTHSLSIGWGSSDGLSSFQKGHPSRSEKQKFPLTWTQRL